jgi:hypothetical protein
MADRNTAVRMKILNRTGMWYRYRKTRVLDAASLQQCNFLGLPLDLLGDERATLPVLCLGAYGAHTAAGTLEDCCFVVVSTTTVFSAGKPLPAALAHGCARMNAAQHNAHSLFSIAPLNPGCACSSLRVFLK